MKIQIFSDLHVDVSSIKPISIMLGVDLVIVAGDTCEGVLRAFDYLRQIVAVHIPILMVLGNHEYYRRFIPHGNRRWRGPHASRVQYSPVGERRDRAGRRSLCRRHALDGLSDLW